MNSWFSIIFFGNYATNVESSFHGYIVFQKMVFHFVNIDIDKEEKVDGYNINI